MNRMLKQLPHDLVDWLTGEGGFKERYGDEGNWPDEEVRTSVCSQLGLAMLPIQADHVDLSVFEDLRALCSRHRVLPTFKEEIVLHVVMPNPWDEVAKRAVRRHTHLELRVLGCTESAFDVAMAEIDSRLASRVQQRNLTPKPAAVKPAEAWIIPDKFAQLARDIIRNCYETGASDFQIEPSEKHVDIRFFYGAEWEVLPPVEGRYREALVKSFKDGAGLSNISENAFQSGKSHFTFDGVPIDVRLEVSPSAWGDGVSGRILETRRFGTEARLPFEGVIAKIARHCLSQKQGLILAVGPTGSGKTTTLYSCLRTLDSSGKNIRTVEDPPEYSMDRVYQIEVGEKVQRTFAKALKSLLRQKPDVILVGEIRDAEVAQICVEAALTGHLVFATLHANDATGAVPRLLEMGIPPFLLQSTLLVAFGQRLVPVLCPNCKKPEAIGPDEAAHFAMYGMTPPLQSFTRAGCPHCMNRGTIGKRPMFEAFYPDRVLQESIQAGVSANNLRDAWEKSGGESMIKFGLSLVAAGEVQWEEVKAYETKPISV